MPAVVYMKAKAWSSIICWDRPDQMIASNLPKSLISHAGKKVFVATEWEMFSIKNLNSYSIITAIGGLGVSIHHQNRELLLNTDTTDTKYPLTVQNFADVVNKINIYIYIFFNFVFFKMNSLGSTKCNYVCTCESYLFIL